MKSSSNILIREEWSLQAIKWYLEHVRRLITSGKFSRETLLVFEREEAIAEEALDIYGELYSVVE